MNHWLLQDILLEVVSPWRVVDTLPWGWRLPLDLNPESQTCQNSCRRPPTGGSLTTQGTFMTFGAKRHWFTDKALFTDFISILAWEGLTFFFCNGPVTETAGRTTDKFTVFWKVTLLVADTRLRSPDFDFNWTRGLHKHWLSFIWLTTTGRLGVICGARATSTTILASASARKLTPRLLSLRRRETRLTTIFLVVGLVPELMFLGVLVCARTGTRSTPIRLMFLYVLLSHRQNIIREQPISKKGGIAQLIPGVRFQSWSNIF